MFDLNSFKEIKEAKEKVNAVYEAHSEVYEHIMSEGFNFMYQYSETEDSIHLKNAAEKFFEALRHKRTDPRTYVYISVIFYLYDEVEQAIRYLGYAEELDPHFHELPGLRELIYS
jgi:tetratricopeptide (TPR) repeat protein